MVWYIINEYETFASEEPTHAWRVMKECQNKRDADKEALELNFDEFCKDKSHRWPEKYRKKSSTSLTTEEKKQIVAHVLININDRTGSQNQYWGRGYYIVSSDKLKIRKNTKKIADIHSLIQGDELSEAERSEEDERSEAAAESSDSEDEQHEGEEQRENNDEQSEGDEEQNESDRETHLLADSQLLSAQDSDHETKSEHSEQITEPVIVEKPEYDSDLGTELSD